jgi:hypothetical protein
MTFLAQQTWLAVAQAKGKPIPPPASRPIWANTIHWSWTVRGKVDTSITLASGQAQLAQSFCLPPGEAVLVPHVTVLDDIPAHLAVANLPQAQEPWIVLSDQPPSVQSFARYGR